MTAISWF